jgi:hypothetical protein
MLRMTAKNICGRLYVSVYCQAHGLDYPHVVWSRSRHVGAEDAATELTAMSDAAAECLSAWEQGQFEFTDDCFSSCADDPPMSARWK